MVQSVTLFIYKATSMCSRPAHTASRRVEQRKDLASSCRKANTSALPVLDEDRVVGVAKLKVFGHHPQVVKVPAAVVSPTVAKAPGASSPLWSHSVTSPVP